MFRHLAKRLLPLVKTSPSKDDLDKFVDYLIVEFKNEPDTFATSLVFTNKVFSYFQRDQLFAFGTVQFAASVWMILAPTAAGRKAKTRVQQFSLPCAPFTFFAGGSASIVPPFLPVL